MWKSSPLKDLVDTPEEDKRFVSASSGARVEARHPQPKTYDSNSDKSASKTVHSTDFDFERVHRKAEVAVVVVVVAEIQNKAEKGRTGGLVYTDWMERASEAVN